MSSLRKRISDRLVAAQQEYAMLTTFNEVNMQQILSIRANNKDKFFDQHGVKLGFMSFFVLAVVEALKQHLILNASVENNDIVYHRYVDIGIAVSAERGLVVPVVRNADAKSLSSIELEINQLANKARENKLSIDELIGGTFTITNGGVFGSMLSTPIVNPPQSAILGMHSIEKRPIVVEDEIKVGSMMYLALSYDHRIIDGREAVLFLSHIKTIIEDPIQLLLHL
jgi:2-oxoglutarate dehydrogenase E2 component (dihydrolipoamide succinyltransferase)